MGYRFVTSCQFVTTGASGVQVRWTPKFGQVAKRESRRLMQLIGLEAIYRRPNTSKPNPGHKVYPYLLRGLEINRVNQVWATDITYIPMARGFLYLVAIMDWHSRYVLAWRLSNTLEVDFCVAALEEALSKGRPQIFNTDQGSQFTSEAFTSMLLAQGVQVSMDGRGRCMDNVFVERLWRSIKYEEVYLKAYQNGTEARTGQNLSVSGVGFGFVATGPGESAHPARVSHAHCYLGLPQPSDQQPLVPAGRFTHGHGGVLLHKVFQQPGNAPRRVVEPEHRTL